LRRQTHSLCDAFACRFVAAHERALPFVPDGMGVDWAGEGPDPPRPDAWPEGSPDADAYVWSTSGSTAAPKGVSITHRTVIARDLGRSTVDRRVRPVSRYLAYLPLAHGGGNEVVSILRPNVEAHILPGERFARDPGELLRLVATTGATSLGGAPSALRAAFRAVERRPDGVDLSKVEQLTFSMEMIPPDLVDEVREVGGRFGLRPEALNVAYGLREGGTTLTPPGTGVRIDEIDLDTLATEGRAVSPEPGRQVKRVVSCGWPSPNVELRIAGTTGALPDRHVGEIQFRGPRVMKGYDGPGDDDPFDDGWLRTGDLGYADGGELFVTGRDKEVNIQQGRKYHPAVLEWAAARVPGVTGRCVAFSPVGAGEGEVVIAVEGADGADVEARVRAAVTNAVGLVPRHVLVLDDGAIPVAPAGKLQRLAARDAYARGELG
jgi:fatty-acyl-CoA synthase